MTTLIFLPGHMCDARAWAHVCQHLTGVEYAIHHAGLDRDDDVDAMARRVLHDHHGSLILVGFSMGAIVALAMHRAASHRIAGLCLAGVNASADLPERSVDRIVHQQLVREGRMLDVVETVFLPNYFDREHEGSPELRDLCLDMAAAVGSDAFLRQSEALRTRPDARPGLSAIRCPTLVIGGEEDRLCPPAWHRETAAAIPGATLVIMPGGHMALIERPQQMAEIIGGWLSGLKELPHD